MAKKTEGVVRLNNVKIKRKGVHSKKQSSALKTSKNYLKKYKGQG